MTLVHMSIKGAQQLRATFERLDGALGTGQLMRAAVAGILPIRNAARDEAPRRTGNLQGEIYESVVGVTPEEVTVAVGWRHGTSSRTPAFYGLFIHEGTKNRERKHGLGPTGRMSQNRFLVRAFDSEMATAERITHRVFKGEIRKAVRMGGGGGHGG